MLSSEQLKKIVTEARPIIERQIEDATKLAGLRDVVAAAGGDWSQLKALIKAQVRDEEAGDGKHVRKILDKADYALGYADMLGLGGSNMNEENFSDKPEHDADGVVIERSGGAPEARLSPKQEVAGSSPAQITSSRAADDARASAGVGNSPAGTEGEADRQPIHEPETIPPAADPTVVVSEAGGDSAPSLAAIPVADHSKPNPICRDPGDCGVYASWHLPCERCRREAMQARAA